MAFYDEIFASFPVLITERLYMREISADDAEAYYGYMSHPVVSEFVSDEDIPKSVEHARQELGYWGGLFRNRTSIYWAVIEKSTNKMIGACGFNFWNILHSKVEISYDLDYNYWGNGFMTEALVAMFEYTFGKMQVNRCQAYVTTTNHRSIKILDKFGFQPEGILREYKVVHGQFDSPMMYSLLASEYKR